MNKIFRCILSIPVAAIASIIVNIVFMYLIKIFKYINTTIYDYAEWSPRFISGIIFVTVLYFMLPVKRKLSLIIAFIIILLVLVTNKIYFNIYEIAFFIGGLSCIVNILISPPDDDIKSV